MRSLSTTTRAAIASLMLVMLAVPAAYADDPPSEPPQARIRPPIGSDISARIKPPGGEPTADSRIRPPIGDPTEDARIKPPSGEPAGDSRIRPPIGDPSFFELMLDWLQARIGPPIG